jgi:hypothetical protein
MDAILTLILSTSRKYLVDLGIISKTISDEAISKGTETIQQSLLSTLQDYGKQGTAELDEKLQKLKKQPIVERLNYLYGDNTFTGRYGIDIIKVCIVIFLFMSSVTYFQIQNKLLEVKQEWPKYKCRPDVMPFAGWINAPDGMSPLEYTKQNFMELRALRRAFDKTQEHTKGNEPTRTFPPQTGHGDRFQYSYHLFWCNWLYFPGGTRISGY